MTQLSELVEMIFGFAFKSADFTIDQTDPKLLRGDNIAQGRLRWDGVKRFPLDRSSEVERYQLAVGDVVLAMDRPWIPAGLKYSVVRADDLPCLLVQRVARLRARSDMDQGFLAAVIGSKGFTDYITGVQTGSAVPHISGRQISEFTLDRLPPLAEQQGIAAVARSFDQKLESNGRVARLSLSLLDAMSLRLSGTLPGVALGDLATPIRATVDPTTMGDDVVEHFSLPAFDASATPDRVPASSIMSLKLRVPSSVILVSRLNPRINRTWWVQPADPMTAMASTEFLALSAESKQSLASVWLAVRDEYFISELRRRVTGTSGSHQRVRPDDALSIEVPNFGLISDPDKETALALLTKVDNLRRESTALRSLRETVMPELLAGRLRSDTPEMELQ